MTVTTEALVLRVCPAGSEGSVWCDVTFRYEPPSGPVGFYNGLADIELIKDSDTGATVEVTDKERERLTEFITECMGDNQ